MTSTDVPDTLKWNNSLYTIEKAQTKLPTFVRKVTELQVKAIKCLCSSLELDHSTTIRAILFLHSYFSGDYRVLRANFASTHVALVVYWAQCDALQKQGKNITDSERTPSASASPFQENSYFKKVCTASFKLLEVEKFFNSKVKSSQPNNSAYNQYGQLLFNFNESFTAKRAKAERITDHESELNKYAFLFGNDEKSYNKFVKIFESVVEFSVAGQYELSDLIACLVYLVAPLLRIDLEALGQLEFQSPAEDIGPLMTFAEDLMRCLDLKLNGVLKVPIEEGEGEGEEVVEIDLKNTKWIFDYYSPGTAQENSRNDPADSSSSSPDASSRMDQGHGTKDTTAEDSNSKDPQTSKHEPSQTDDINSGASTITTDYLTNNESAILNGKTPKLDDSKSTDHSKSPQANLITPLTPSQSSLDPIPKILKSPLEPKKTEILADPDMEGREVIHYSGMIIIKPDPTANKGRSGSKPSSPVEEKSPATATATTPAAATATTAQNGRKRRWSVTEKGSKTAGSGSTVDSNSETGSRNDNKKRTRNSRKNSAY